MQEYRMIEEVVCVYGDRDRALRMVERLCMGGATIEEACERLILMETTGNPVLSLEDLCEDEDALPVNTDHKKDYLDAGRYARERERAQAQAYRLMMKHHKAREVARFKRQKRIYGGLT